MFVLPTVSLFAMITHLRRCLNHHLLPSKCQLDDYGFKSDSFPNWFSTRLPPSLAILVLRSATIFGIIPFFLGRVVGLSVLSLTGNSLTGDILTVLDGLRHLTHLNLSRNALNGSIPAVLITLSNLSLLDHSVFSCPNSLSEFTIIRSAGAPHHCCLSPTQTSPPVIIATFLVTGRHQIPFPLPLSPHETKESP